MIILNLFLTFLKIGAFTFGGGYAMLPFIQQEVIRNGWLTSEELIDFVAISESTPGPFAVNAATYIGMRTAGPAGAVCATLGVILPSFIIILLIARAYERFQRNKAVGGAMIGLKGAVVGLIGAAVISTAMTLYEVSGGIEKPVELIAGGILLALFLTGLKFKLNPILIIVISAVAGIILRPLIS